MILAVTDDFLFRSKLEATARALGTSLTVAADAGSMQGYAWSRGLIDLNLSRGDAIAMVRDIRAAHPNLPIIGYCSHVQQDLQQQALAAGCTAVLPRSTFVQQLPALFVP